MDDGIVVIDVPIAVPPEEASRMLSEPVSRGYYVKGVTAGEPMRVLFAPYAPDNRCADELRAIDLAVAYRHETATRIVQLLCKTGIFRSATWVKKTLDDMCA